MSYPRQRGTGRQAWQTAGILFEVLCAVNKNAKLEEIPDIVRLHRDVQEKKHMYVPFNILSLNAASASQSIMQLEEIKASVKALRNTRGLTWPSAFEPERQKGGELDLLDWLRAMFGFQRDSVRNQREHMILLFSNLHIRLEPKPVPLSQACSSKIFSLTDFMDINVISIRSMGYLIHNKWGIP